MDFVNQINELGLIQQLAMILAGVTVVLVILLQKLVSERKAIVHKLFKANLDLQEIAGRRSNRPTAYAAPVDELIANDADLALTREYQEYRALIGLTPPWLVQELALDRRPLTLSSRVARWIEYARGSLLMATLGSGVAFIGALIATSRLLLFAAVGILMVVLGLQILYGAAQEAGLVGTTILEKPEPTDDDLKDIDKVAKSSH
jgi:hypothetical protein